MTDISNARPAVIAYWLFAMCGLVFAMVVIGAITRLTESGLSMVEWRLLMGTIPPLSDAEWARVFTLYQESPEYQKKHYWMDMNDFQIIFFWEWFHRFMGRLIGLCFFIPLVFFWIRGWIPKHYKLPLIGLFILGGLQGVMGWYMVKSGLVDNPNVSHYRLAAHLGLAFLIFGLLLWTGLTLIRENIARYQSKALYTHAWVILGLYTITVFWGAYVAGLHAGLIYNDTFPQMGDHWIPENMWYYQPYWINFFENHAGVQFVHRWLGMGLVFAVFTLWLHGLMRNIAPGALHGLMIMAMLQMGLGIATLMTSVWLPLGVLHQAGALMILMFLVILMRQIKPVL